MKKIISVLFVCALVLIGCGSNKEETKKDDKIIRIGASSAPHAEILESVKEDLKSEGYTLEIKIFDDYVLPNTAVNDGDLDANYFQHTPYLDSFNKDKGTDVVAVKKIHFEPLGIYAGGKEEIKYTDFSVKDIKDGSVIVVPDDASNEARALQLLADKGIIELKDGAGLKATKSDITKNPKNVEIKEVAAEGIPKTLEDVDFAIINGNYAISGKVEDRFILGESKDSEGADTYANIVAVKKGNETTDKTKALVKVLTSQKTKEFIEKKYGNLVVPVFK